MSVKAEEAVFLADGLPAEVQITLGKTVQLQGLRPEWAVNGLLLHSFPPNNTQFIMLQLNHLFQCFTSLGQKAKP